MATGDNKSLYLAFAGLLALLIATIAINFAPLGGAHVWIGLGIAVTKTIVVVVIFMGLTRSPRAARLAAGAGLLWLSFAIIFVMADYMTRGWDETQEPGLKRSEHFTTYDRVEYSAEPIKSAVKSKAE
ncbi:MAG: cytochrome C oxidase subunit IV family protein [Planctomycetota bacterium]